MRLSFLSDPPPPPLKWLWRGIVPACALVTLVGAPGGGKTALATALALAVARGEPLLDRDVQQGAALVVSAEAATSTMRRLRAMAEDDHELPISHASGQLDLVDPDAASQIVALIDATRDRFQQRTRLVVIDALASATRGSDENSGKDMGRAMGALQEVIQARSVTVLLLAHTPKGGGDLVRGHSSVLGDVDAHVSLTGSGDLKRIQIIKMRDAEAGLTVPLRLVVEDQDLFRVLPTEGTARSAARPSRLSRDASAALEALQGLGGEASLDAWRTACVEAFGPRPSGGAIREALRKAKVALTAGGLITISQDTVTVTNTVTDVTSGDAGKRGEGVT